ncbi:MAG TPA: hypothetical protein VEX38_06125 [Fimbriimonadaceae bacterium]|nr:hypothetical protein [Fimbriimonadaceae bacterium]
MVSSVLLLLLLQSEVPPTSVFWFSNLRPTAAEAVELHKQFLKQVEGRQWELAHGTATRIVNQKELDENTRLYLTWASHELLLIGGKPERAVEIAKKHLQPFGVVKGVSVKKPADTLEVFQAIGSDELDRGLLEKMAQWQTSYAYALTLGETAAVMTGDFKFALWCVEEQEQVPVMCGTGMKAVWAGRQVRKRVYSAAMKDFKVVEHYARRGFVPEDEKFMNRDWQIANAAAYAKFALAGAASGAQKRVAYKRLQDELSLEELVYDRALLFWIAREVVRT